MIRPARREELETCAAVVRESFATVAPQYGITRESAPRHTSFLSADRLRERGPRTRRDAYRGDWEGRRDRYDR